MDFIHEIVFINTKTIRWGTRIETLLKEIKPRRDIKDDCITLVWGDVNFFGAILEASSTFYPEADNPVKQRHIKEIVMMGEIESHKHAKVIDGVNSVIGDSTGHQELSNYSSHNWIFEDIEVSSTYNTNTKNLKLILRK